MCGSVASLAADSVPPLINYQGRLTDSSGTSLPAGTYGVTFRFWDRQSMTAGQTLVWGGDYDVTIVEGGAFNVILGAPSGRALTDSPPPAVNDLAFAFGDSNRFLGLTITRDKDGKPGPNPTEILPRQQILSAPFAFEAGRAAKAEAITTNAVVRTVNLAAGAVTPDKLLPRIVSSNAPLGGIAVSPTISWDGGVRTTSTAVPGLEVTLVSSGRPVLILCLSSGDDFRESRVDITTKTDGPTVGAGIQLFRGETLIGHQRVSLYDGFHAHKSAWYPPSTFQFLDLPAAGTTNRYTIQVQTEGNTKIELGYFRIAAFEL